MKDPSPKGLIVDAAGCSNIFLLSFTGFYEGVYSLPEFIAIIVHRNFFGRKCVNVKLFIDKVAVLRNNRYRKF